MLSEMNLLDMCVQESLRMYPTAGRSVSGAISECDSTKNEICLCNSKFCFISFFICTYFISRKTMFWGKVIFSQVFVCPRGVGFPTCITGHMTRGVCIQELCIQWGSYAGGSASKGVCIRGVCIQGGWADPPKLHGIVWDAVNKWAVRILVLFEIKIKKV